MEAPVKNDVWHKLSQVDVSHLVQSKNGMDFVPWMDAWAELKKHYPDATMYKHWPTSSLEDGSYMVFVTVTIPSLQVAHTDMLPVKDFRNKAIFNPNTMDINTAFQRCMVKTIAGLGLGYKLWSHIEDETAAAPVKSSRSTDAVLNKVKQVRHDEL